MNSDTNNLEVQSGGDHLREVERAVAIEKLQRIRTEADISEQEFLRIFKHFIWRSNRFKRKLLHAYEPPRFAAKAA